MIVLGIMGTTGKGTISSFFLGSVSRKVATFSHCGVIIVPHRDGGDIFSTVKAGT